MLLKPQEDPTLRQMLVCVWGGQGTAGQEGATGSIASVLLSTAHKGSFREGMRC